MVTSWLSLFCMGGHDPYETHNLGKENLFELGNIPLCNTLYCISPG